MEYLDIDYEKAERIYLTTGCNGEFYIYKDNSQEVFIKQFNCDKIEKLNITKSLLNIKYDGINAFPKKIVRAKRQEKGYSCIYYPDAICFSEKEIVNVPYELRLKATSQVEEQMRLLHDNGYIINDVRLSNNMFSLSLNDAFMIDFEDMILESDYKTKLTYYRFKNDATEILPPSKWEDIKKQFICNLSLMLLYDFEYLIKCKGPEKLLEYLKEFKEIYEFTKQLFSEDKLLYFSEIKDHFYDEEKVLHYQQKLENKNIHRIGRV